jgi:hypothetical protein
MNFCHRLKSLSTKEKAFLLKQQKSKLLFSLTICIVEKLPKLSVFFNIDGMLMGIVCK